MEGSQQKLAFEEVIGHRKPAKVFCVLMLLFALILMALLIPLGKLDRPVGKGKCAVHRKTPLMSFITDAPPRWAS